MLAIYDKNNQYFEVLGLIDGTTHDPSPTYINDATGTIAVINAADEQQIIGDSDAKKLTLEFVTGSNGNYRALITKDFIAKPGVKYWAIVDLTTPEGAVGHWEIPLEVAVRRK